ncbi:UdgX family uracil-DNA binding protein [Sulfitobacter guttiformis]|uniref:Type-4 uracil-DNA glycosylase n=1 Tax=Sulfitobacter guttiformis TaxID=74349 RepID=A0A420DTZ1_9RHOB|nr:UdgX family uracil-DNA binding protein [Sulfitobacter guttiformis]KIN71129.1 putative uracil-DNA glycosylase [Sulfitobacter guttiformis KCTC 32187]RKE97609.1 DNA polymerase [Sulfitobacter guttiformis]
MIFAPRLPRLGTYEAWRDAARALASNDVAADDVEWTMEGDAESLFGGGSPLPASRDMTVPAGFVPMAKLICAHRTEGSHDLLYRVLLRCRGNTRLLGNRADAEVQQLEAWAKNIRRDMHKMKAFVRFREITKQGANRRQFISWFEPDHRIEELIAPFFTRRFGDMDWVIVTPEVTTRFAAGDLDHKAVTSARLDLSDETEELWKTYYANIFNPARLKIKAMQSEMPKKYWKNLPEADLIPGLIAGAEARMRKMQEDAPTLPPMRAERILERLPQREVADDLHACTRCPIGAQATQAVPGTGPTDATLMIVGEQPGDQEDLAGLPFVGPAGQLFDAIATEAGLDRSAAYVTNAVKHFKFTPRGKRRIHQSPHRKEVDACRVWLEREIAQIQPALIIALGATAAQTLTGDGAALMTRRGRVERGREGIPVLITLHPSALLRSGESESMRALLLADLQLAAAMTARLAAL